MDYKIIRREREKAGISQTDFAKMIKVTKQTLYKYEQGIITNIPSDKIEEIANALGVSPSYIMGWEDTTEEPAPKRKGVAIPVLGHVAAGIPIEMIEDIIDTEEIPEDMAKHGEFFALKIKGDSMTPSINNSDVVIVRQQEDAENGDIVIATVNGNDAVCKRLKKYSDGLSLISLNPAYEPLYFNTSEIQGTPVKIIGKVVELRRKF
jgi:lexA repressor